MSKRTVVIVDQPSDWPTQVPGVEVVLARNYLVDPKWAGERYVRVFNLCRSYKYQSAGYYVSLLAVARRHRPFPDLMVVLDMKSRASVRTVDEELDDVIQASLAGIRSERFELSVYFGSNVAKRHQKLAKQLFARFPAPLFRANFQHGERWKLTSLAPIGFRDVPADHHASVFAAATEYFGRARFHAPAKREARFDLAILVDPNEELAPSDPKALERFERAFEDVGFRTEQIGRDDYGRLAEFDALFIRETTAVNHHTFRFAHRAESEGLVVIDDPQSILRCTNKIFQAEAFERRGVPTPRTLITDKVDVAEVEREIGFPCVLKVPDSAFSQGVVKCADAAELAATGARFLEATELILIQKYTPSEFDWRIGVFDGQALYACRYRMARGHWQIVKKSDQGKYSYGRVEPVALEDVPPRVVKVALQAAATIGDGLYGVDLKALGKEVVVTEVNDNPNINVGCEDVLAKGGLYETIARGFLARVEKKKGIAARGDA